MLTFRLFTDPLPLGPPLLGCLFEDAAVDDSSFSGAWKLTLGDVDTEPDISEE